MSATFELVQDKPASGRESAGREPRFRLWTPEELAKLPPPTWLLEGFIAENSLAALFGPAGVGKSFLALDWAMRIATHAAWLGHATRWGPVLYIASEGGVGLAHRVKAYRDAREVTRDLRLWFCREPVNLLDARDVRELLASWTALETGLRPALVVFDTLSRSLPGADENSAQDVGLAIAATDLIRRETGAAVLLVHHTGKDGLQERGSSALRGACDAMFSLKETDGALVLTSEKQKDAPEAEPVRLRLVPVGGEDSSSCIIEPYQGTASGPGLTPNERRALEALVQVAMADGASDKEWRENSQLPNGSYYRARKRLVDLGHVTWEGRPKRYALSGTGLSLALPTPNNSQ